MTELNLMEKFLFVYNARSGKLNALLDAAHKIISPKTYACDLCALTFDAFSENARWKAFRTSVKIDMKFYHVEEFEVKYPEKTLTYPLVVKKTENSLDVVLTNDDLKKIVSVVDLIKRISSELYHLK